MNLLGTNRREEASKQLVLRPEVVAAPLEAAPAASGAARFASVLRAAESLDSRWEAANSCIGGSRRHSSRSMGSHSRATGSRADSHTHSIHSSQQAATDPYKGYRHSRREAGRLQVPRYSACLRRSIPLSRLIERNCHSTSQVPPRQPNRNRDLTCPISAEIQPVIRPATTPYKCYLNKVTSRLPLPTTFPYLSRVRLSCESYEPSRAKYLSTKTCLDPSI